MDHDNVSCKETAPTSGGKDDVKPRSLRSDPLTNSSTAENDSKLANILRRSADDSNQVRAWRPSLWRLGPVSGIFGMIFAMASLFASLGILAGSDKSLVTSWSAPPSTYLAAFTAIANLSIRYALIQGTLISWWAGALKGSSLSQLHYAWRAGTSLHGALLAGRRMGLVGLACIASIVVMLDGPLLQRASKAVSGPNQGAPFQVTVNMAPQLPIGYTGGWVSSTGFGGQLFFQSGSWNETVPIPGGSVPNDIVVLTWSRSVWQREIDKNWEETRNLKGVVKGCPGQCKITIAAPALFPTTCETKHVPMNYVGNYNIHNVVTYQMAPPLDSYGFMVSSVIDVEGENERMVLVTGSSTTHPGAETRADCNSTFTYKTCILEPGVAEYDVEVQGDEILMDKIGDPKFVSNVNYPVQKAKGGGPHDSTLAGIIHNMWIKWDARVSFVRKPGVGSQALSSGPPAIDVFTRHAHGYICTTYRDPRDVVVADLNKLMIYAGAFAAQGILEGKATLGADKDAQVRRLVEAQPSGQTNTYHTDYSYFVAASVLELVCIILIAPTYWGWWRIGRPVSFSPLEIAKAFESPMFANCNSNSSGRQLARTMEGTNVHYGSIAADEEHQNSKIAFGKHIQHVTEPQVGQTFGV